MVGTGLHSGRAVRLRVLPTSANVGVMFRCVDITDRDNLVQANFKAVNDTRLCTRISNDAGVEVSTVEHLMAALAGCGVHNAIVELDGPEVPIMDGSSKRFVHEILTAGVSELDAPAKILRVLKSVSVSDGDAFAEISPADEFEIDFTIDFEERAIGVQQYTMNMKNGGFARELSDCRTFCRQADVDTMQAAGLALGGNLSNAVVVDGDDIVNDEGFRRADECVRHKMLDALGDLALVGTPILGHYRGVRAGHSITNQLLRKLFATPDAFEIVEADETQASKLPGVGLTFEEFALAV